MSKAARTGLGLAAVLAAGIGGYWAGQRDLALPVLSWLRTVPWPSENTAQAAVYPAPSGPVIYYRDPDGHPAYSAAPKRTPDGRDFVAVRASEDVSFADGAKARETTRAAQAPAADTTKRLLYYRNPMGLPDTSPTPKKDSMGMDYIPVYEGDGDSGSTVKVAAGKLQRTGVKTQAAAERIIVDPVRVPGTVQLDERHMTVVTTRSDAFVNKVADVTTGDRVRKGQALLQLYSPEIAAASAMFLTNLNSGARDSALGGARQRLENLGVPPEAIAEIEQTRKVPLSMTWRSPRDGIILQRNAVDGMKVAAGDVLFRLADTSSVWVVADVPEYQIGAVKVGAAVTIRLRGQPSEVFSGQVALIYPQVASDTRTTKIRIEIPNPDGVLKPDMYVSIEIASGSGQPVLAVPDDAVIDTGTRQLVIMDVGDGRFEPREVRIGQQGGGFTEIRTGVVSGDKVVVAANFLIDAESNLKAALSGMSSAEATP